jgi:hypothetical protein
MTTQPPAPDAPQPDPQDEVMKRALEIHRRLAQEHNWDFYGALRDIAAAKNQPPAPKPESGASRPDAEKPDAETPGADEAEHPGEG